jgi:hypothetical protein
MTDPDNQPFRPGVLPEPVYLARLAKAQQELVGREVSDTTRAFEIFRAQITNFFMAYYRFYEATLIKMRERVTNGGEPVDLVVDESVSRALKNVTDEDVVLPLIKLSQAYIAAGLQGSADAEAVRFIRSDIKAQLLKTKGSMVELFNQEQLPDELGYHIHKLQQQADRIEEQEQWEHDHLFAPPDHLI